MSGQTVSFSTSAPAIATVSGQGQVSAVGPMGAATITASIGTFSASVPITVVAGAVASLTRTSADPGTVTPGAPAGDSVRFVVRDAFGNPRVAELVIFSIAAGGGQASPATAPSDAQGRVATRFTTGVSAGTNTLSATAGAITPISFSVMTVAGNVVVSSISPSPMTPGAVVTITGAGFDPTASGNAVTIGGQAATISSATATQLVITVPTTLPCAPTHQTNVQVTANGETGIGRESLRVGALRTLATGSAIVLTNPSEIRCTELAPASGRYVVNVLDGSENPAAITPFRFAGATSSPAASSLAPGVTTLRQTLGARVFGPSLPGMQKLHSTYSAGHSAVLESNRSIFRSMKTRFPRSGRPTTTASARRSVATAAPVVVGDTRTFRVVQFTVGGLATCNDFVEITARAVYVGTKAIVYEDVAAPLATQMDDKFTQLGQEFDTNMYASVATYFADPLVNDQGTDADQHLNMVFTPTIPSGVGGFVTSCDLFPRNESFNQVSNFGENFYARVPTVATGSGPDNPDGFLRSMRSTVVHEVKHIASNSARLVNGSSSLEESWLEEGAAFVAEEVWARDHVYPGAAWKGNMTYASTLFCDVRPSVQMCAGRPFVVFGHFALLYEFLDAPGSMSLFGRVSDDDFTFYGTAWSFIRYNVDRYAPSEAPYLRGITNSSDLIGLANLARQSSTDPTHLLGMWSLSLYLDENGATAGNADVNFPSWNSRDIFAGMNNDFQSQGSFTKPYPLVPQFLSNGDFTIDHAGIHGGSFAPYDLGGQGGATRTIGLSGSAGGPAPSSLRLVIARVQ